MANPRLVADTNFHRLGGNPYPGRGLILGRDETGEHLVQLYFLMGRSENSRNRVLRQDGSRLFTNFAEDLGGDSSLVIYDAMLAEKGNFVVSNGDQTLTVIKGLRTGASFEETLQLRTFEPDDPSFTPRITGLCSTRDGPVLQFSVLRRSPWSFPERHTFAKDDVAPGFGYGIHTYRDNGDPLPSWNGEPVLLPLRGGMREIADTYWNHLNPDFRVSLAVRFIHHEREIIETLIINARE
jgi:hypothetical protein